MRHRRHSWRPDGAGQDAADAHIPRVRTAALRADLTAPVSAVRSLLEAAQSPAPADTAGRCPRCGAGSAVGSLLRLGVQWSDYASTPSTGSTLLQVPQEQAGAPRPAPDHRAACGRAGSCRPPSPACGTRTRGSHESANGRGAGGPRRKAANANKQTNGHEGALHHIASPDAWRDGVRSAVAYASASQNWANECNKFTPDLKFFKLDGNAAQRRELFSRQDVHYAEYATHSLPSTARMLVLAVSHDLKHSRGDRGACSSIGMRSMALRACSNGGTGTTCSYRRKRHSARGCRAVPC